MRVNLLGSRGRRVRPARGGFVLRRGHGKRSVLKAVWLAAEILPSAKPSKLSSGWVRGEVPPNQSPEAAIRAAAEAQQPAAPCRLQPHL